MSKILFATDVHGNQVIYEKILELGEKKDITVVIIGGDIAPSFDLMEQRSFLQSCLVPLIKDFKNKTKKDVFIMMGNDDYSVNMDILIKAEKNKILKLLSEKIHKINDFNIIGYSYMTNVPFLIKDWERKESEIKKDLWKLGSQINPKKTICVFHTPPFNTDLDILYNGTHIGDPIVREFIENFQPYLTLHGHIHESPDMSGSFSDKISHTLCVNPGDNRIVIIDLNNLEKIEVVNLLK